jgi:iron complex outermembrane receptor protein
MNATSGSKIAVAGALAALATSAYAADTAASSDTDLQEVVVTARLRSESLQEVPVAVDAYSSKTIQDAGMRDYNDFVALTPNVSLVSSPRRCSTSIPSRC